MTECKRKENRYHMISHEGKDGLTYLTFPVLDGAENVRHLFSTRKGGVSRGIYESMNLSFHRGDPDENVLENYRRICGAAGFPYEGLTASAQDHHTFMRRVGRQDRGVGIFRPRDLESVDGLVTDEPDVVLVIDALAAKNIRRVSTTIQISDSGIAPGAGMGNRRREISETTLGCRVIAIGVPTVIDARTLILDAAKASEAEAEQAGIAQASRCENLVADENRTHAEAAHADFLERYLADEAFDMIVTSTDIDAVIQSFSQILANAINITLHPGIYS